MTVTVTAPPSAVLFDIGNVLFHWDPVPFYDRVIGAGRRRALFAAVDLHAMNAAIDLGEPFAATVDATARAHPEWSDEIRLWHDRWIDMAVPSIPHAQRLLRSLRRRGIAVFALSNFGVGPFDLAATVYPILHDFDRTYISGRLRLSKPDPAIYRHVERDCGLARDALLFTDDRPENIAAAAARGWRTHLFDGPQGWADRLVAEGLLTQEDAA